MRQKRQQHTTPGHNPSTAAAPFGPPLLASGVLVRARVPCAVCAVVVTVAVVTVFGVGKVRTWISLVKLDEMLGVSRWVIRMWSRWRLRKHHVLPEVVKP